MLLTPFVWFHPSSYFVLSLTSWFERRWKSEGFLPLVLLRKRVSDVYSLVLSFFSLLFSFSLFSLFSLRAHIRTHEYNNVSFPSLPLSFSPAVEKICSTTSLWFSKLAHIFKKTSKKQWNIFGVYPKSEYFCTRFPGEESLAELTWWQSVGPPNYKNKKTPEKFGS